MDTNALLQRKEYLQKIRRDLRSWERSLDSRQKALSNFPNVKGHGLPQTIENSLRQFLPETHMPGNVGGMNRVMWPFWYNLNFDFGTDPTITNTLSQTQSFQVTQGSVFIVMSISRHSDDSEAESAPFVINLRDRQSTRFMNDQPLPLQMFGKRSEATILPTPFLLMPNASFEIEMKGFAPFNVALTGDIKYQFSFFGYRVRTEDADKVLSTIFGQR